MTDPNNTDDETPIRTWTRMDPDRERPEQPDGAPDPFSFFGPGTGDGPDL